MAFQRKKAAVIGVKAPFPGSIEPVLAASIEKVLRGERWVHEIKFDGYRVQVHLRDGAVKFFTRRGSDWTRRDRHPVLQGPRTNGQKRKSRTSKRQSMMASQSRKRRKFSTELIALMRSSRSVESWDWSRKSANHE